MHRLSMETIDNVIDYVIYITYDGDYELLATHTFCFSLQ